MKYFEILVVLVVGTWIQKGIYVLRRNIFNSTCLSQSCSLTTVQDMKLSMPSEAKVCLSLFPTFLFPNCFTDLLVDGVTD